MAEKSSKASFTKYWDSKKKRALFSENAYMHLYTDILHPPPYSHTQSLTAPRVTITGYALLKLF